MVFEKSNFWNPDDFDFAYPGLLATLPKVRPDDLIVCGVANDGNIFAMSGGVEDIFSYEFFCFFIWSPSWNKWVDLSFQTAYSARCADNPYVLEGSRRLSLELHALIDARKLEQSNDETSGLLTAWQEFKNHIRAKQNVETLYTAAWKKPKC